MYARPNPTLEDFWQMLTTDGAIDSEYGIFEGAPADLVVLDEPSPQWAILRQAGRRTVIKDGRVVVRNGELSSR